MENEIKELIQDIIADYAVWQNNGDNNKIKEQMFEEFSNGIRVQEGRKYIKIITGNSVWGFIVSVDNDKKFRRGDILKAASWAIPARNQARGNILDGGYSIRWTGPHYL